MDSPMQSLYEAVRAGDAAGVSAVVAANPTFAIFAAALSGDVSALENLLTGNRSLISAVSPDGWLPLHLAAHFGKEKAARLLLNTGAEANARSTNALTNTALHAAAAGRSVGVAKLLIDHGADVNARQHSGWCPLHAAAQNGDVALAKLLIEAGADVSARADNQQRPLDLALTRGQQAMVDLLETQGASL
jgi:ankyrin repeat protein